MWPLCDTQWWWSLLVTKPQKKPLTLMCNRRWQYRPTNWKKPPTSPDPSVIWSPILISSMTIFLLVCWLYYFIFLLCLFSFIIENTYCVIAGYPGGFNSQLLRALYRDWSVKRSWKAQCGLWEWGAFWGNTGTSLKFHPPLPSTPNSPLPNSFVRSMF